MPGNEASGTYKNIIAAAERGEYSLVEPMDYQILGHLHDEGTMFANAYRLGHTTQQISRDVFEGMIPASQMGPRMSSLKAQKLVIQFEVPGTLGKKSYQRTQKGKQVYEEWSSRNGSESQDSSASQG